MKMLREDNIKVKVVMITYNQEDSIGSAIEGVLMQKTDFEVQLVIGEDCSSDNTRKICEEYTAKYPGKIILLPSIRNLGMQANSFRVMQACYDAPYVAFIEGDDEWTDKCKLSRQVHFLESNRQFSAHAHNVIRHRLASVNGRDPEGMNDGYFNQSIDKQLSLKELFSGWSFHVVSLMVRGELLRLIPFSELPYFISVDRFLSKWIGCHGALYYEGTQNMAIYYIHGHGASSNSNYLEVRYQDLLVLSFMEPYIEDKSVYNEERLNAIQQLFYYLAKGAKGHIGKTWPYAFEYLQRASLRNRSTIYYLLLIVFGRTFLWLDQRIRGVSKLNVKNS